MKIFRLFTAIITFALLAKGLAAAEKAPEKLSPLDTAVPDESFLTLSLRIEKLLEKANYEKLVNWRPAIANNRGIADGIKALVADPSSLGLNLKTPTHIFAQRSNGKNKGLILGALSLVNDKEVLDNHLDSIAKTFGIEARKNKGLTLRAKKGLPFLTAQRGNLLLFLFAAPSAMDSPLIEEQDEVAGVSNRLQSLAASILGPKEKAPKPDELATHLKRPYDLALQFDVGNFADFAKSFAPDEQFARLVEAIEVLDGSLSLTALANNGRLTFKLNALPKGRKKLFSGSVSKELVARLPNGAIGVGGISLDPVTLKRLLQKILQKEDEKLESELELSPIDSIDAFAGDLVFAWSQHRKALPILTADTMPDWSQAPAAFFLGAEIADTRKLDLLLSAANKSNLLDYALSSSGLSLERKENQLFITTIDHRREIISGKSLHPLGKKHQASLAKGPLLAQLDLRAFARSLRKAIVPHYDFLMFMDIVEEFDKISLSVDAEGSFLMHVFMRDKKQNALATLAKRLETEFTDRRNMNLFRAIAANDLQRVDQQIRQGALVNAPDRSGHTPMHFAAYRGSAGIFEYLLRNGGEINVRGRDRGTPLHSAVWGRNEEVVKVLLENGAEVNAKSDEGETPVMTAALRGELEILEILLSLAANPRARDKHDTGPLELAAAGGHREIVTKLKSLGLKSKYPFHMAAGLGDKYAVQKFITSGKPVDELDGFGATPLIYATISGKRDVFQYLLNKKADPKIVAKQGYTLMHAAAFSKDKKLLSQLIGLGLDVNARFGDEGITPTDVAHDSPEAVQLLRIHGGKASWELGRP